MRDCKVAPDKYKWVSELVDLGISPQEIVLAFHHPSDRALTDITFTLRQLVA